jgi:phage repressor protein C with HTH and peptisase S24 domain
MYKIAPMHNTMKNLYRIAKDRFGIDGPSDLGQKLNESAQTINNWENRGISKRGILLAANIFGIDARAIEGDAGFYFDSTTVTSIDNNNEVDRLLIKHVNLKLSAGITGFGVEMSVEDKTPLGFQREWFNKRGYNPDKLLAVTVSGQSMEPRLNDGDTVIINTADAKPVDGDVFAINYEGELLIKRLVRDDGDWWLSSDNSDAIKYPRKRCAGDICLIIGRIVHKQSERI